MTIDDSNFQTVCLISMIITRAQCRPLYWLISFAQWEKNLHIICSSEKKKLSVFGGNILNDQKRSKVKFESVLEPGNQNERDRLGLFSLYWRTNNLHSLNNVNHRHHQNNSYSTKKIYSSMSSLSNENRRAESKRVLRQKKKNRKLEIFPSIIPNLIFGQLFPNEIEKIAEEKHFGWL